MLSVLVRFIELILIIGISSVVIAVSVAVDINLGIKSFLESICKSKEESEVSK